MTCSEAIANDTDEVVESVRGAVWEEDRGEDTARGRRQNLAKEGTGQA